MATQKCSGRNVFTGDPVSITFDKSILSVARSDGPSDLWLAPGFIDLQVNGFAGVDYNSPTASHESIRDSLLSQFATGTTRLYPTVITGPSDAMTACLRNLAN